MAPDWVLCSMLCVVPPNFQLTTIQHTHPEPYIIWSVVTCRWQRIHEVRAVRCWKPNESVNVSLDARNVLSLTHDFRCLTVVLCCMCNWAGIQAPTQALPSFSLRTLYWGPDKAGYNGMYLSKGELAQPSQTDVCWLHAHGVITMMVWSLYIYIVCL